MPEVVADISMPLDGFVADRHDVVDGWGDESPFDLPVFVVTSRPRLEQTQVRHSPNAAHLTYRLTWDQS